MNGVGCTVGGKAGHPGSIKKIRCCLDQKFKTFFFSDTPKIQIYSFFVNAKFLTAFLFWQRLMRFQNLSQYWLR